MEDEEDEDDDDTDDGDVDGEGDREPPSFASTWYRSPACTLIMLDLADKGGHGCGSVRTTTSNVLLSRG